MFKLVVLSALLAIAAAKPGLIAPVSYTVAETHGVARVGDIVQHVPSAVSHQSSTVVHSKAALVSPLVAPVVQKTIVAEHAPLVYSSPVLAKTVIAGPHLGYAPSHIAYTAPGLHYGVPAVKYVSSPLAYSSPLVNAW